MKHNHQSVQARVAELVPDVRKLEFGCKVKDLKRKTRIVLEFIPKAQDKSDAFVKLANRDEWEPDYFFLENFRKDFKIIGRDCTLADVLRAIRQISGEWHNEEFLMMMEFPGSLEHANIGTSAGMIRWDLSKPLSGQSQECLDFLGELLIKK